MKVFIASDHAGFTLKAALVPYIETLGHEVEDLGAHALDPQDDYPDFITPCAEKVASEVGSFAVILGGSGQGEAMAANRIKGVRAAVFYGKERMKATLEVEGRGGDDGFDPVRLAREHNDANILSLGARFISAEEAVEAIRVFLETPFGGAERHARRIAKF